MDCEFAFASASASASALVSVVLKTHSRIRKLAQWRMVDILNVVSGPIRLRRRRCCGLLQSFWHGILALRDVRRRLDGSVASPQDEPGGGQRERPQRHCHCGE